MAPKTQLTDCVDSGDISNQYMLMLTLTIVIMMASFSTHNETVPQQPQQPLIEIYNKEGMLPEKERRKKQYGEYSAKKTKNNFFNAVFDTKTKVNIARTTEHYIRSTIV